MTYCLHGEKRRSHSKQRQKSKTHAKLLAHLVVGPSKRDIFDQTVLFTNQSVEVDWFLFQSRAVSFEIYCCE